MSGDIKNYAILSKRRLAANVCEFKIYAPLVAKHCKAGQFLILRVSEDGERVPFTICDYSREEGSICVLVQEVGYTTAMMSRLSEGDALQDVVGPLGNPTDLSKYKHICLVGGGIGSAVIYPQAKQLIKDGKAADIIVGARNKSLLMYEEEFKACAKGAYFVTDDGSNGNKGTVVDMLSRLIADGNEYDCVFAVGPLGMMKAVSKFTEPYGIPTVVSMNSLMVDGTGMCGCCRLTVGGKIKYACVDGPEFDGHAVDFDEAMSRSRMYKGQEEEHLCRLRGEI